MKHPRCGLRCAAIVIAIAALCRPAAGAAEPSSPRRLSVEARGTYHILDAGFFGLSDAPGVAAAFRCEIVPDISVENAFGFFATEGAGVSVNGFDYAFSVVALLPFFAPYRPVARAGVGFLSVDPVTVTPTSTFRPAQTAFYLVGGVGVSRSITDRVHLEAGASFWVTPYRYRVYAFDRREVLLTEERFAHLGLSLGAVYSF